jgi:hypothetical protein
MYACGLLKHLERIMKLRRRVAAGLGTAGLKLAHKRLALLDLLLRLRQLHLQGKCLLELLLNLLLCLLKLRFQQQRTCVLFRHLQLRLSVIRLQRLGPLLCMFYCASQFSIQFICLF